MFDLAACLKICAQINNKLKQITSIIGREEAMKHQIRIQVLGLGWDDWHHPWYVARHEFTVEELAENIKTLIKSYNKRKIYAKPLGDMLTRKKLAVLGPVSLDIIRLDANNVA